MPWWAWISWIAIILITLSAAGVNFIWILIGLAIVAVLILASFLWGIYFWVRTLSRTEDAEDGSETLGGL